MGIDGARIAEEIIAPDAGENLFAVEHAPRMAGKQIEQLDLARRAGDALTAELDAVTFGLNLQRAEGQRGQLFFLHGFRRGRRAPQDGFDAGNDLARAEGLDDIIVRAHFKPQNAVDFLAAGGEHDDGELALFADSLTDLHAGHPGHHLIQKHQVVMLFFDHFKRLLAVVGGIMEKFLVIQIQGERLMDDGVIVADQDARCFAHGDHLRSNISLF